MSKPTDSSEREILYAKDVKLVTGLSIRASRYKLFRLRKALGKDKHSMITIEEFCTFYKISEESVRRHLK